MFFKPRTISKIAITPPSPAPHRSGLGIVLIVRNEATHIAEWAQFHLAAGVRHFIVYDNGCTDATIPTLRDVLPTDALTVMPWDQKLADGRSGAEIHNQVLAYAHALRNFGAGFRWLAFIDVDEFMVPVVAPDLPTALAPLGDQAQVSLPWHMFGRNGHEAMPDGGILPNYLMRSDPQLANHSANWKCIVDPTRVTGVRVHGFDVDGAGTGVNDVGRPATHADRGNAAFYSNAAIQLNHYYTRSNAELQAKINRGSNKTVAAQKHLRRVMRIVDEIEQNTVRDERAIHFWQKHKPSA